MGPFLDLQTSFTLSRASSGSELAAMPRQIGEVIATHTMGVHQARSPTAAD